MGQANERDFDWRSGSNCNFYHRFCIRDTFEEEMTSTSLLGIVSL